MKVDFNEHMLLKFIRFLRKLQKGENMKYSYKTKSVCSTKITFDIDKDVVTNIKFEGGCNGNLKAIAKLVDGQTVDYIESKLLGNKCGFRNTSCADQLAIAVRQAYEENK